VVAGVRCGVFEEEGAENGQREEDVLILLVPVLSRLANETGYKAERPYSSTMTGRAWAMLIRGLYFGRMSGASCPGAFSGMVQASALPLDRTSRGSSASEQGWSSWTEVAVGCSGDICT
jgi:hypothetical protein